MISDNLIRWSARKLVPGDFIRTSHAIGIVLYASKSCASESPWLNNYIDLVLLVNDKKIYSFRTPEDMLYPLIVSINEKSLDK